MFIALQETAYMTVKAKSINASSEMTVTNFIKVPWELGLNPNTISLPMLTNADGQCQEISHHPQAMYEAHKSQLLKMGQLLNLATLAWIQGNSTEFYVYLC